MHRAPYALTALALAACTPATPSEPLEGPSLAICLSSDGRTTLALEGTGDGRTRVHRFSNGRRDGAEDASLSPKDPFLERIMFGGAEVACDRPAGVRAAGFTTSRSLTIAQDKPGQVRLVERPFRGAPARQLLGVVEEGKQSATFMFDDAGSRVIVYAPQSGGATYAVWRGGQKEWEEPFLALVDRPATSVR